MNVRTFREVVTGIADDRRTVIEVKEQWSAPRDKAAATWRTCYDRKGRANAAAVASSNPGRSNERSIRAHRG